MSERNQVLECPERKVKGEYSNPANTEAKIIEISYCPTCGYNTEHVSMCIPCMAAKGSKKA